MASQQESKAALRQQMPSIADAVDRFRAEFGETVKVLWAKENGLEVGAIPGGHSISISYDPEFGKVKTKSKKR